MTIWTLIFALAALAFWLLSVYRDGGIGIGSRFFFAAILVLYFLAGPLLRAAFATKEYDTFGVSEYGDAAVQLVSLGLISFVAAAYWAFPAFCRQGSLIPSDLLRRMASRERLKSERLGAWMLAVFGAIVFLLTLVIGRIPTLAALLGSISGAFDAALSMFCLVAVASRRFKMLWIVALAWIARSVLVAAASGHIGGMLFQGMVLVCYTWFTADIRPQRIIVALLLIALLYVPYQRWMAGRDDLRQAIANGEDLSERLSITSRILFDPGEKADRGHNFVEGYCSRGDFSALMAAAIRTTPSAEPFAYGATFCDAATAVVPRFLWPEKPYLAGISNTVIVSRYTGINFGSNTCVQMNYLFEFYINFGVTGCVIGMFLAGLLCAGIEMWFYTGGLKDVSVEWTVLLINSSIILSIDNFAMLAMTLPPVLAASWLLNLCFKYQSQRQMANG